MSRLTRDGTAEAVSRDQVLRRERGQGNIHFPCSADHEQDWQPYPGDPYPLVMAIHTSNKESGGGAQGAQGSSKICTSRESVSPLSRLIRGFRNKYH